MLPEPMEPDAWSRFDALRAESLELLETAESLVDEMRSALDHCRRHRPVVEVNQTPTARPASSPRVKSHRGGRVTKKRTGRRWRRRPR
ncbi:MAG TPA: hypothetical protein VHC22_25185 [Pirellulales bacterium]|nr:hypothetical protein [Pirellulales bacterium]